MKRLAIAMATVFLMVSCFVFTAGAAENTVSVAVEVPESVSVGETFSVAVKTTDNPGFNTFAISLVYPDGYAYVEGSAEVDEGIKANFLLGGGETYIFYHDAENNAVTFVGGVASGNYTDVATLFSADFKVVSTTAKGLDFTVEAADTIFNAGGEEVSISCVGASVGNIGKAAYIETRTTYLSATQKYYADIYFFGADANAVSFGYKYGENLTFVGFTPENSLVSEVFYEVNDAENRYYAALVAADPSVSSHIIRGTDAEGVHLGTFEFNFTGGEYSSDDSDNIQTTRPLSAVDGLCTENYFLYLPDKHLSLEIESYQVYFEPIEISSVEGNVEVVAKFGPKDGVTTANFGTIKIVDITGGAETVLAQVSENETEAVVDEDDIYSISCTANKLTGKNIRIIVEKQGYVPVIYEPEITIENSNNYIITIDMLAGDIKDPSLSFEEAVANDGYGVVDIEDYVRVLRGFDSENPALINATNINEDYAPNGDNIVNVSDLAIAKKNYGMATSDYGTEGEDALIIIKEIEG